MLGIFEIGSQKLFAQGWLQTAILISASQVARIIGVSLDFNSLVLSNPGYDLSWNLP
jgi:hypothetical protein